MSNPADPKDDNPSLSTPVIKRRELVFAGAAVAAGLVFVKGSEAVANDDECKDKDKDDDDFKDTHRFDAAVLMNACWVGFGRGMRGFNESNPARIRLKPTVVKLGWESELPYIWTACKDGLNNDLIDKFQARWLQLGTNCARAANEDEGALITDCHFATEYKKLPINYSPGDPGEFDDKIKKGEWRGNYTLTGLGHGLARPGPVRVVRMDALKRARCLSRRHVHKNSNNENEANERGWKKTWCCAEACGKRSADTSTQEEVSVPVFTKAWDWTKEQKDLCFYRLKRMRSRAALVGAVIRVENREPAVEPPDDGNDVWIEGFGCG